MLSNSVFTSTGVSKNNLLSLNFTIEHMELFLHAVNGEYVNGARYLDAKYRSDVYCTFVLCSKDQTLSYAWYCFDLE